MTADSGPSTQEKVLAWVEVLEGGARAKGLDLPAVVEGWLKQLGLEPPVEVAIIAEVYRREQEVSS